MADLHNGTCECGERCSCPPGSEARARCNCWHAGEVKPEKVYGLMISQSSQRPLIEKHCFGDCGKISMAGGIDDDHVGALMVCCEDKCPWLFKQMDEPYGTTMSFGRPHEVFLRALTDTPAAVFHCAREGMCDATPRCTAQCAACADGVLGNEGGQSNG